MIYQTYMNGQNTLQIAVKHNREGRLWTFFFRLSYIEVSIFKIVKTDKIEMVLEEIFEMFDNYIFQLLEIHITILYTQLALYRRVFFTRNF